jgi:protein arginine kinase activator
MVNGEYAEYRLCSECARELGYGGMFPDFGDFGGMLSSFLGAALPARSGAARCSICGSTMNDIKKSGKVGCANCYELFFNELTPTIRGIHGNTEHIGKHPVIEYTAEEDPQDAPQDTAKANETDRLATLKAELKQAIEDEKFERAAELRDEIKKLEG